MSKRIFLSPPDFGVEEEKAAVRAIRSGWLAPVGPEINAFETELEEFVGSGHAVALSSGTAALHLALKAVGVGEGDVVIAPTMTFVATANAISYLGAEPVFVDVESHGNIDANLLDQAIVSERHRGSEVAALVPVDIYGRMADHDSITEISNRYGIPVVVDAAESFGASLGSRRAGSLGAVSVVSFNGNKIMTTSGGGAAITADLEKSNHIRFLASQARESAIHYEHEMLGYNYRLSNVLAAIGRAQLGKLPSMLSKRKQRRDQYLSFFSRFEGLNLLSSDAEGDNCWITSLVVDQDQHDWTSLELQSHLEAQNIESRPLWKPMHLQPLYKKSRFFGGSVSERLFSAGLALPSGSAMSDSDMDRVLDAISAFLESR